MMEAMAEEQTITGAISSLVAPTVQDMKRWQALTLEERRALMKARADQAVAAPRRTMTADEILAEAKANFKNG